MNIGGDMIGTMTNTLILSFIGSSLLLVLAYIHVIKYNCNRSNKHRSNSNRKRMCFIRKYRNCIYSTNNSSNICFINRDKSVYKVKSENIVEGKKKFKNIKREYFYSLFYYSVSVKVSFISNSLSSRETFKSNLITDFTFILFFIKLRHRSNFFHH